MDRAGAIAAGVGAIAFGLLTFAAIVIGGPMGGNYAAADVANYISGGRVVIVGAIALWGLLGAAGLICLGAYLRHRADAEAAGSIWPQVMWGLTLGSAICFAVSWGIFVSQPIGNNEAGTNLNVPPTIIYSIGIAGDELIFESAATLLGLAMILGAVTNLPRLPGWLRWITLAVGILAITSLAFFPFFLILLWAIVMGIWLLAGGRRPAAASP